MANAPVTSGRGLPVGGTQEQVTSTSANVGPNALLAAGNYPATTAAGPGPLTSITPVSQLWRINNTPGVGQNTLPNSWTSLTAPYVYNNTASNLGGITQTSMLIDGYPVVAGTYVYQFMELSLGTVALFAGGPPVMFRGCRIRAAASSPGFFNSQSGGYNQNIYFHYCDFGGAGKTSECDIAVQIAQCAGIRFLRNYISWCGSGIFPGVPAAGFCDVIENLIENITLYNAGLHLNGIKWQGGDLNCLCLRNCVVVPQYDVLGNQITQTDCIAFIPTNGTFPGTGTNSDGSTGYFVEGNLLAGTGYCFYGGADGSIANLTVLNNQWTTSSYLSTGGANGPGTHLPAWGTGGNFQANNTWADGPSHGQAVGFL